MKIPLIFTSIILMLGGCGEAQAKIRFERHVERRVEVQGSGLFAPLAAYIAEKANARMQRKCAGGRYDDLLVAYQVVNANGRVETRFRYKRTCSK